MYRACGRRFDPCSCQKSCYDWKSVVSKIDGLRIFLTLSLPIFYFRKKNQHNSSKWRKFFIHKNMRAYFTELDMVSVNMKWQPPDLMTYISDKVLFPKLQFSIFITCELHDNFNYHLKIIKNKKINFWKKRKSSPMGIYAWT